LKTEAEDERAELIVRYLLGGLSPAERERLEGEYFGDDAFFERVMAVEGELIDSYVRGDLPADDRVRFESIFLADARRRKRVAFARDLLDALVREVSPATLQATTPRARVSPRSRTLFPFMRRPAFTFTLTAVAVVLLMLAVWLAFERGQRRDAAPEAARDNPAQPTQAPQASGAPESVTIPAPAETAETRTTAEENGSRLPPSAADTPPRGNTPSATRPQPAVATLVLSPVSRDAGGSNPPNRLNVPAGTKLISLLVEPGAGGVYESYSAEVETVEGRGVWKGNPTRASGPARKVVTVNVPAAALKPGAYILKLRGARVGAELEDVGEYYFAVVNR
jgi:anti-sigma factor RsiW